ncbi:BTAD domain-containing putative transcriptional regulator [Streptomyces sp. NPDC050548]|uniref:BTAD domain-containing putative transcriptional regulator n=1 Tax=Streptomyces sp. NPDC050548 TaxID=3365629 RepID=UPI0037BDBA39
MDQGQESFGDALRRRRRSAKLTQLELARKSGVSVRAIRYLESGQVRRPGATLRYRLNAVLSQGAGTDPSGLFLGILGPVLIRHAGAEIPLNAAKPRLLLTLLALRPNEVVGRDEIVDALWQPGEAPSTCANLVHTYVARLRKVLPPRRGDDGNGHTPRIERSRGGYVLHVTVEESDVLNFTTLFERADTLDDAHLRAETLLAALRCWRGRLGGDLSDQAHLLPDGARATQTRIDCAIAFADLAIPLGRHGEAVCELQRLVADEPWHEALHARLMLALAGSGRRAAALEVFQDIRTRLRTDLGLEPGAELPAAQLAILQDNFPQPPPVS